MGLGPAASLAWSGSAGACAHVGALGWAWDVVSPATRPWGGSCARSPRTLPEPPWSCRRDGCRKCWRVTSLQQRGPSGCSSLRGRSPAADRRGPYHGLKNTAAKLKPEPPGAVPPAEEQRDGNVRIGAREPEKLSPKEDRMRHRSGAAWTYGRPRPSSHARANTFRSQTLGLPIPSRV